MMELYDKGLNKRESNMRQTAQNCKLSHGITTQPRNVTMRQAQKGANEKEIKQVDRYKYKIKHNTNMKSNTHTNTNTNTIT